MTIALQVHFSRPGSDGNMICHHEGTVESKTEMANDGLTVFYSFVFIQKFLCTGKSYLVDITPYFIGGHTNAFVRNGQVPSFLLTITLC